MWSCAQHLLHSCGDVCPDRQSGDRRYAPGESHLVHEDPADLTLNIALSSASDYAGGKLLFDERVTAARMHPIQVPCCAVPALLSTRDAISRLREHSQPSCEIGRAMPFAAHVALRLARARCRHRSRRQATPCCVHTHFRQARKSHHVRPRVARHAAPCCASNRTQRRLWILRPQTPIAPVQLVHHTASLALPVVAASAPRAAGQ